MVTGQVATLLFKARSNSIEMNDRTYRFNKGRNMKCVEIGLFMGPLKPLFIY